jgi:hypothetical protein
MKEKNNWDKDDIFLFTTKIYFKMIQALNLFYIFDVVLINK